MSQTRQTQPNKTKKFGKYDVKREFSDNYRDTIIFEDNSVNEIMHKLDITLNRNPSSEIIPLDYVHDAYRGVDKVFYHIVDSTVRLERQFKNQRNNSNNNLYSLKIINKNHAKRKITRKFLEEVLK